MRKIIHIDMDAFYASVEQRDNPHLRGKPVVVGGDPKSRGVVASASYEARRFGIRSAISCAQAYRLCPHTQFVYPNFEKYLAASRKINEIFKSYTQLVEPLALDEAYLDVTANCLGKTLARDIAAQIKEKIQRELNLTASAGVGPNKFIAKLASELRKPNGLVVIPPERVFEFVEHLPVEKLWGVGPATTSKLHSIGIKTTADIRARSVSEIENLLGSHALFLYELSHGRDERLVESDFEPRSRGSEMTFEQDVSNPKTLLKHIQSLSEEISLELKKLERPGRTITLKIKYADFTVVTRSRTLFHPTDDGSTIGNTASELLFKDTEVRERAVRLIGVAVGNLVGLEDPLQLWFQFPHSTI